MQAPAARQQVGCTLTLKQEVQPWKSAAAVLRQAVGNPYQAATISCHWTKLCRVGEIAWEELGFGLDHVAPVCVELLSPCMMIDDSLEHLAAVTGCSRMVCHELCAVPQGSSGSGQGAADLHAGERARLALR